MSDFLCFSKELLINSFSLLHLCITSLAKSPKLCNNHLDYVACIHIHAECSTALTSVSCHCQPLVCAASKQSPDAIQINVLKYFTSVWCRYSLWETIRLLNQCKHISDTLQVSVFSSGILPFVLFEENECGLINNCCICGGLISPGHSKPLPCSRCLQD